MKTKTNTKADVMVGAAIFDMDGLLVDSEPWWQTAEMSVLNRLGLNITPEETRNTQGLRIDEVIAFWFKQRPWKGPSQEAVRKEILSRVRQEIMRKRGLLPGVFEALEFARHRAKAVLLASSSPHMIIDSVLENFGLQGAFDHVLSAQDEPFGKPHPSVFLTAAGRVGTDPIHCLVFEDSINGVLAAKAARMMCIAVPEANQRKNPRYSIADATLDSLTALTEEIWRRVTSPVTPPIHGDAWSPKCPSGDGA